MAVKKTFDYKLSDAVRLRASGETGIIVGRAHYLNFNPQYLVRYKGGDGRQIENWWTESAIEAN